MEAPLVREEQGATRHEDEMDEDKASALDVYLQFIPAIRDATEKKNSFVVR